MACSGSRTAPAEAHVMQKKMTIITIQIKDNKSSESATAEFDDEEINLFKDYIENTDRLLESSIVRDGMPSNLRVKIENGKSILCNVQLPDEDSILAFLHRMRRFILKNERSSYDKVTGILARRFNSPRVRSIIKVNRKIYEGANFQNTMQIRSNGEIINSEKILFDWLNAFEYHNEQAKREQIERLHKLFPFEASRAIFMIMLSEKVKAIMAIADFISLILGKVKVIETKA